MGIFGRKRRDDGEPVDPDARSPQLGVKYKDLAVLGQLRENGADLLLPRHVLHYSYFSSEKDAAAARDELGRAGWPSEVRQPPLDYPGQWSLVAEQNDVVLSLELVRDSSDLFEAVAARHAGEYDGWEASV